MGARTTQPKGPAPIAPLSARARKQLVDARRRALSNALSFIDFALRGTRSPSLLKSADELLQRMADAIEANELDHTIDLPVTAPEPKRARRRTTTARG